MLGKTVKITSKGQATIPKEIRDLLKTDVVEFEIIKGNVVLKPVRSVAAALSAYSKGYTSLDAIRKTVWQEVANERAGQ